jgi:hypothetical protein
MNDSSKGKHEACYELRHRVCDKSKGGEISPRQ